MLYSIDPAPSARAMAQEQMKLASGALNRPSHVSDATARVVGKALEKDKASRFADVRSMRDAMQQALVVSGSAEYDVFISYRVRSDADRAMKLYETLTGARRIGPTNEQAR